MSVIGVHEATWLLVERADGSPRGVALVAKPEPGMEVGQELSYSFGTFTVVGFEDTGFEGFTVLGQRPTFSGYGCIRVRQGVNGPEVWEIAGDADFRGRIDMRAA